MIGEDIQQEIVELRNAQELLFSKERKIKERILAGASIESGKYSVRLVPKTLQMSTNPNDYVLEVISCEVCS